MRYRTSFFAYSHIFSGSGRWPQFSFWELFESFTHGRYQGQKRFSLEGAESLIPALHQFVETAAETGLPVTDAVRFGGQILARAVLDHAAG